MAVKVIGSFSFIGYKMQAAQLGTKAVITAVEKAISGA